MDRRAPRRRRQANPKIRRNVAGTIACPPKPTGCGRWERRRKKFLPVLSHWPQPVGVGGGKEAPFSMHPLPRLGARRRGEEENLVLAAAGRHDHAVAGAELHLPRGEVGRANHQPADQLLGPIDRLDAGKDVDRCGRRPG